ncbi:MAG: hypothetical protein AABX84_00290, partial [Nanoarchaeota archaeon]
KKYSWKEWNKRKYDKEKESDKLTKELIDLKKMKIRQNKMLSNIKKMVIKNGKILILTGSYHLKFFEKKLNNAIFPFRN